MLERGNGAVINVSSGSTVHPTPLMTAYSASKSFVESFGEALQAEYPCITVQTVRYVLGTNFGWYELSG